MKRPRRSRKLSVTEKDFQKSVVELARLLGWKVGHFHDSRRQVRPGIFVGDKDAAGIPDLIMVKNRSLVFAELKSETGTVSDAQESWLKALDLVQGRVYTCVWRPSDLQSAAAFLQRAG